MEWAVEQMSNKRSAEHQSAVLDRRRSNAAGIHQTSQKYLPEDIEIQEQLEEQ